MITPIKCNINSYETPLWYETFEESLECMAIAGTVVVSKKQLMNAIYTGHTAFFVIINDGMFFKNKYEVVDGTSNELLQKIRDHYYGDIPEGDYRITCWYSRYDDDDGAWVDPECRIDYVG